VSAVIVRPDAWMHVETADPHARNLAAVVNDETSTTALLVVMD
jgi:hypothetical protein